MVVNDNKQVMRAQGVSFSYGSREVLSNVDLSLAQGQLMGIIGPNGSGKSTLLGLLSGLLKPSTGSIDLMGKPLDVYARPQLARVLGLVPQHPQLSPGFTVMESVLTGRFALMKGRAFENQADLDAAHQALVRTDLVDLAEHHAGELSGGECQRLALARATAAEPKVLLLDEPTSALDLRHQLKIMGMLEKACRESGLSVCLVSHDLNLASLFCQHLLLLHKGRTLAQGRPDQVLTPEIIKQSYRVQAIVDSEPSRGRPRVTLTAESL